MWNLQLPAWQSVTKSRRHLNVSSGGYYHRTPVSTAGRDTGALSYFDLYASRQRILSKVNFHIQCALCVDVKEHFHRIGFENLIVIWMKYIYFYAVTLQEKKARRGISSKAKRRHYCHHQYLPEDLQSILRHKVSVGDEPGSEVNTEKKVGVFTPPPTFASQYNKVLQIVIPIGQVMIYFLQCSCLGLLSTSIMIVRVGIGV